MLDVTLAAVCGDMLPPFCFVYEVANSYILHLLGLHRSQWQRHGSYFLYILLQSLLKTDGNPMM